MAAGPSPTERVESGREALRSMSQSATGIDAFLRDVLDACPDAAVLVSAVGRIEGWNARASTLFGWSAGEASGVALVDLIVPPHLREAVRTRLAEHVARAGAVGRTTRMEVPLVRRNGSELAADVALGVVAGPRGRCAVLFVHDLTKAREAEAAIQEGERRLRQIIDLVPHFIFAKDTEGRFVLVNEAVARAYGTSVPALLGKRDADFNPDATEVDHFRNDDLEVIRGGRPKRIPEEVLTDAEGNTRVLDTIKIPFVLGDGRSAVLGVATDITERKRVEAELLHSQKMEGIGRLAGGVAHDFNNLLTAILGYVQMLEERLPADSELRADTRPIRDAAERATALTRQLLTFARRDRVRPQLVDLSALTVDLDRLLRRVLGSPIALVTQPSPEPCVVEVDPGQLEQVIVNLVVNARDAMPKGGRLVVATRCKDAKAGDGAEGSDRHDVPGGPAASPTGWVELTVADTGEGIPPDVLPRIFEPFFTTKGAGVGTGLGLAICYGIVERYGGRISAESEIGRGTTLRVLLPRSTQTPAGRVVVRDGTTPRGTETVLVVDDEESVRDVLVRALSDAGYRVLSVGSPGAAAALAAAHDGPIHLLVADVVMPGMSGSDVAEAIVRARPTMRVLYVSGYHDPEHVREVGAVVSELLMKPFTPSDLARKVRAVLDRPTP